MLTRFFQWLGIRRRLSLAERRCARAERDIQGTWKRIERLDRAQQEHDSTQQELNQKRSEEMKHLERTLRSSEDAIAALRAALEVDAETITGLVAANKLLVERIDADTAIQVRRQATHLHQGEL